MRWRAWLACGRSTWSLQQQSRSIGTAPRLAPRPHFPKGSRMRKPKQRETHVEQVARRFDQKTRKLQKLAGTATDAATPRETIRKRPAKHGSNERQSKVPSQLRVEYLRDLDGGTDAPHTGSSGPISGKADTAKTEEHGQGRADASGSHRQNTASTRLKDLGSEELKAKPGHDEEPLQEQPRYHHVPVSVVAHEKKIFAKHEDLEFWDKTTTPPTLHERIFANNFFSRHPKRLLFTAGDLHQVTLTDVPEVAFIGRSNAGKSTLMNAICGDRVAYTSKHPGRTQTLNGWAVGGMDRTGRKHKLTVLDLPGYGHRSRQRWGHTVTHYFNKRKELKRVFVLISAEHGLKSNDKEMLKALREAAIPHQVILSKIDRLIHPPHVKESNMSFNRLQKVVGRVHMGQLQDRMESIIRKIGEQSAKGGLPTITDVLCCAGKSLIIPGEHPEPPGSLGISALRWAIINAAGLQPHAKVKDEKDFSF